MGRMMSDTGYGRRARIGVLAVVGALFLITGVTRGQQVTPTSERLVGNTHTATVIGYTFGTGVEAFAQAFTTGSHADGYKLTSAGVDLSVSSGMTDPTYSVKIHSVSSNLPGSSLGTLTNPVLSTGVRQFTAPGGGINLDASTTYFLVLTVSSVGDRATSIRTTTSGTETGMEGWSIANTGLSSPLNGTLAPVSHVGKIEIHGYERDQTAPTVDSANTRVYGDKLTLTFDELLDSESVPHTNAFRVPLARLDGSRHVGIIPAKVEISGKVVTLTLPEWSLQRAAPGDTVTVSYIVANVGDEATNGPIQDRWGNDVAGFSGQAVHNDTPDAPMHSSATVNGKAVTITFDKALDAESVPTGAAFSVTGRLGTSDLATISGSEVSFTLASPIPHGEDVTVGYTPPSENPLQDSVGKQFSPVLAFSGKPVTNNTPAAPVFHSASVNGNDLTITFNKALDATVRPAGSAFTVSGAGADRTGTGTVRMRGATVSLYLDSALSQGDEVTVSYTPPATDPLQDTNTSRVVAFSGESVNNGTGLTPLITSVGITSTPKLDADGDGTPDTYGAGELIFVDVAFDEQLAVDDGGSPSNIHVRLPMAPNSALDLDEGLRRVPFFALGRGGRVMRFQYEVEASDRDADGVYVQPDPNDDTVVFLETGSGARVYNATAAEADAELRGVEVRGRSEPPGGRQRAVGRHDAADDDRRVGGRGGADDHLRRGPRCDGGPGRERLHVE